MFSLNVLFLINSLNPDFWLVEITYSIQTKLGTKIQVAMITYVSVLIFSSLRVWCRISKATAGYCKFLRVIKEAGGRLANRDKACAEDQVLCPYALTLVSLPILFSVRQNRQRKVLTSCRCFWLYFVRSSYKV